MGSQTAAARSSGRLGRSVGRSVDKTEPANLVRNVCPLSGAAGYTGEGSEPGEYSGLSGREPNEVRADATAVLSSCWNMI